jgi:HK97 family phage prohead protease
MLKFTTNQVTIEAAEGGERRISGLAVPYDADAVVLGGTKVRVLDGALPTDGTAPRLLAEHDPTRVIGLVTERSSEPGVGMSFTARIASTREGDDILELLTMGALDSVSVGITPTDSDYENGTLVVRAADWEELSVVYSPAFKAAKISEVAASEDAETDEEPNPEPDSKEEEMENQPEEVETVEASTPETIPTPTVFATAKKFTMPGLGDYLQAMREGGHRWHQMNDNIRAATGDVLVSDGSIPTPVVGSIYDDIDARRPVVSALGVRALPAEGSSFQRPYYSAHAVSDQQSAELASLNTADVAISQKTFTKITVGTVNTLSEQVIDWSAPSMLEAVVQDQASSYALKTENYAVGQLAGAMTNAQEIIVSDFTSATEIIGDIYTGAASIAETGNYLPNALVVSPAKWAVLGSLVDSSGRPVFPQVSPINGIGNLPGGATSYTGNPLGLQLVVSNQVSTQAVGNQQAQDYLWLMNTRGIEFYEQYKGFVQATNAGTLGIEIAVRGYVACEVMDANMIRFLGPDATF